MKKLLFFCCIFAAAFSMSAQNALTKMTQANNSAPAVPMENQVRNSTYLSWANSIDDGVITTAAIDDIIFVQRFTTSDLAPYNGFQLSQIDFYVENNASYPPSGNYSIKVYKGGSYTSGTSMNPGTLIYSQAVPYITYDDLTVVTLNSPITIDASQELWFGVEITNIGSNSYMIGFDETSTVTGKGSIYYDDEDMTWYDLNAINTSFTVSAWDIEAYVVDPNGDDDPIIDLGMTFIDDPDYQNEITSMTVPYGSDFVPYPVVFNYNYGAAIYDFQDTLHFELTLDGSPLGSTGASTVYIASGSGVFWDDYTALYASDIAAYNLYGTHEFCMTVSTGPGWFENDPTDNFACLTVTFDGPSTSNHVITVLNTDNSVSPAGNVAVAHGGSQTFTITPSSCNTIADVLVDGVSVLSNVVNNTYTFNNVTADHSFQVIYNTTYFALSASTDGHGTVSPTSVPSIACGMSQNFTITPHPGYVVDYVTDNTVDVTAQVNNNIYTLSNISADHTIFVAFTQDASQTYTLTATTDGNGMISPTNVAVNGGATQTFTIVPNSGFAIDYVTDNTMDVTASVVNNSYTLNNISANHDIYVAFVQSGTPTNTYTVAASSDGNATVTPANTTVNAGDNLTINITPNAGYLIQTVTDNGADVTAQVSNNAYNINNINENHLVYVTCQLEDAVSDYTAPSILIFPNPASDLVNLRSEENILKVEMYDGMGKLIMNQDVNDFYTELKIASLAPGIYVLKIVSDGQFSIAKIVKR